MDQCAATHTHNWACTWTLCMLSSCCLFVASAASTGTMTKCSLPRNMIPSVVVASACVALVVKGDATERRASRYNLIEISFSSFSFILGSRLYLVALVVQYAPCAIHDAPRATNRPSNEHRNGQVNSLFRCAFAEHGLLLARASDLH